MNVFQYKWLLILIMTCMAGWGAIKLYYELTGGFTVGTITSDLSYDPRWETPLLSIKQQEQVDRALSQSYSYLARGCQSYVFISQDGNYVIKFFKFQHFRPKYWISLLNFIPFVKEYEERNRAKKKKLLETSFKSLEIAFNSLRDETGVIFLHLNKTNDWKRTIMIQDKLGLSHELDLGQLEFVVQRHAENIVSSIEHMMEAHQEIEAKQLIDRLLAMLVSEYLRGFADNDHALMQNTGVLDGYPVHIDVGQFIYNPIVKNPEVYKKEIFDKTFFFHQWLEKHYPELGSYLKDKLVSLIGPDYFLYPAYRHREGGIGKIPAVSNQ